MRHEYVCQTCGRPVIELDGDPTMTICPSCLGHVDTWTDHYYQRREAILNECYRRMEQGAVEYADGDVTVSKANLMRRDVKQDMKEEFYDIINYAVMAIIKLEEQP